MLFHLFHNMIGRQDYAGDGVYIYVSNGTARCVGE